MVSTKLPGKRANHHADHPLAIPPALPPSVEEAYRRKCLQLKQRTREVEDTNDAARVRLARLRRGVEKLRLERAFLLEQLAKRTSTNVEDSEGSPSPPPTVRDVDDSNNYNTGPLSPNHHTTTPSLPVRPSAPARRPKQATQQTPSGFGSTPGTDHENLRLQPQDKPLRSKRGHRKPSVVATGLDTNGPPPAFVNQNAQNLSPSSDAFSHSLAAEASQKGANGASESMKPEPGFELFCQENLLAVQNQKRKTEGMNVDEELARRWKELSDLHQTLYHVRENEEKRDAAQAEAEAKAQAEAEAEAEETPTRDDDVEMDNED